MKYARLLLAFVLLGFWSFVSGGEIFEAMPDFPSEKSGLTISKTALFPQPDHSAEPGILIKEGSLVEVLEKSANEELDRDQNQVFHWFRVQTKNGDSGWIFGDCLALFQQSSALPEHLKVFVRKKLSRGLGSEDLWLWFGLLEGHDTEAFGGAKHEEQYLIASSTNGKNLFLRLAGKNGDGETFPRQVAVQDITGDEKPEFIAEISRQTNDGEPETRSLEIHSLQNGALKPLFTEELTLTCNGVPAPSRFKCVDLESKTIRVEYVEYSPGKDCAALLPENARRFEIEDCLAFVTYTYAWNARSGKFELIYEPTRVAPYIYANNFGVSVRKLPALAGEVVAILSPEEKLKVFGQKDKIVMEKGLKKVESFLLVRTLAGDFGYVSAAKVQWPKIRHGKTLESYGQAPPLLRNLWSFDFPFVRIIAPSGTQPEARND